MSSHKIFKHALLVMLLAQFCEADNIRSKSVNFETKPQKVYSDNSLCASVEYSEYESGLKRRVNVREATKTQGERLISFESSFYTATIDSTVNFAIVQADIVMGSDSSRKLYRTCARSKITKSSVTPTIEQCHDAFDISRRKILDITTSLIESGIVPRDISESCPRHLITDTNLTQISDHKIADVSSLVRSVYSTIYSIDLKTLRVSPEIDTSKIRTMLYSVDDFACQAEVRGDVILYKFYCDPNFYPNHRTSEIVHSTEDLRCYWELQYDTSRQIFTQYSYKPPFFTLPH